MPKGSHYERMPIIDERMDYSSYVPKCSDKTYENCTRISFRQILEEKPLEHFSYVSSKQVEEIVKQKEYQPLVVNPKRYLDQNRRTISEFASYFPSQYGVDNGMLKEKSEKNRIIEQERQLYTSADRVNLHFLSQASDAEEF